MQGNSSVLVQEQGKEGKITMCTCAPCVQEYFVGPVTQDVKYTVITFLNTKIEYRDTKQKRRKENGPQ